MKRMEKLKNNFSLFGMCAVFACAACSTEDMDYRSDLMDGPPIIEVIDEGSQNVNGTTRAMNTTLESFSLYIVDEFYDEDGAIAENVKLTKEEAGWKSRPNFYLINDPQNAYGISPSAQAENLTNVNIAYDTQTFDYSVTNDMTKQSKVKVASRMNFTKKSVNNKLSLTFRDVLFSLNVQAVNEIKDVKIFVKSFKFHNVKPNGRFKFDAKKESRGKWTVDVDDRSTCLDYEQTLETAVELSRTNYRNIVDSAFTLMPQDLYDNLWYPYDCEWADDESMKESFADANTNKHMYIEVKCQITQEKDNQTLYLWGYPAEEVDATHPEYESVYFPYDEYACLSDWTMGVNSIYYLEFNTLTGGYDGTGQHIVPHPTGGLGISAFENAEPVPFKVGSNDDGNVDAWDDATEDIVIPMDGKE